MQGSSKMHRRISQWFTRVGLHHRSEVFVGPYMLDMVIGDRVVVEVDGPSHFYKHTNSRRSSSILKNSLLSAMGFDMKHIPHQEWNQCGTDQKKLLYCASFWREVLPAEVQKQLNIGPPNSQNQNWPQLADIVEMVVGQKSDEHALEEPLVVDKAAAKSKGLPAFYDLEGDEDSEGLQARFRERHSKQLEAMGTEVDEPRNDAAGIETLKKEAAQAQSIDELIGNYEDAERQLASDRERRSVSALDRGSYVRDYSDSKISERKSAAAEWESAFLASQPKDAGIDAQVKALLPRKRRVPARKPLRLSLSPDEQETDDESDDEQTLTSQR